MGVYVVENVKVLSLPKIVIDSTGNLKVDFSIKEEGNYIRLTSYRSDMISFVIKNVKVVEEVVKLAKGTLTWRTGKNKDRYCNTYATLVLSRLEINGLYCVPCEVDPLTVKFAVYKYSLKYFADELKVKSDVPYDIVLSKLKDMHSVLCKFFYILLVISKTLQKKSPFLDNRPTEHYHKHKKSSKITQKKFFFIKNKGFLLKIIHNDKLSLLISLFFYINQ